MIFSVSTAARAANQLIGEILAVLSRQDVISEMRAELGDPDSGTGEDRVRRALQRLQLELDEMFSEPPDGR